MARPLSETLAAAPPGTYDVSTLAVIGSGGAMLSAAVKADLADQLPGAMIMDRFGSSESGAQGVVEVGATGPKFAMSDDTVVLDDDLAPLSPGDGRIGRLARTGRIPLGYYKDEAKTAATFPTDARGVRWSVPGDLASIGNDGVITVHGRGSASINSGGEKIFPEEVEAAVKAHPGRVRRHRGRSARRALRRAGRRRRPDTGRRARPLTRRPASTTAGTTSPATRCRARSWWSTRSR